MTAVTDLLAPGLEQVRKSWGWFLVSGILLMILGVVCIGKAQTATTFSILALGVHGQSEPFHHSDRSVLTRVGEPTPNLAQS